MRIPVAAALLALGVCASALHAWELPPPQPQPAAFASGPRVASSARGHLVVWIEEERGRPEPLLTARLLKPDGTPTGTSSFPLALGHQQDALMAGEEDGSDYLVAFNETPTSSVDQPIRLARIDGESAAVTALPGSPATGLPVALTWTRSVPVLLYVTRSHIYPFRSETCAVAIGDDGSAASGTVCYRSPDTAPSVAGRGREILIASRGRVARLDPLAMPAVGTIERRTFDIFLTDDRKPVHHTALAFTSEGFAAAWTVCSADVCEARVRRFATSARAMTPLGPAVTGTLPRNGGVEQIAVDTDGSLILATSDRTLIRISGETMQEIPHPSSVEQNYHPVLVRTATGLLVIWSAWQGSPTAPRFGTHNVLAGRLSGEDPLILSVRPRSRFSPRIAAGRDSLLAVWSETPTSVWCATLSLDGRPLSTPLRLSSNASALPAVTFDGIHFVVSWADQALAGGKTTAVPFAALVTAGGELQAGPFALPVKWDPQRDPPDSEQSTAVGWDGRQYLLGFAGKLVVFGADGGAASVQAEEFGAHPFIVPDGGRVLLGSASVARCPFVACMDPYFVGAHWADDRTGVGDGSSLPFPRVVPGGGRLALFRGWEQRWLYQIVGGHFLANLPGSEARTHAGWDGSQFLFASAAWLHWLDDHGVAASRPIDTTADAEIAVAVLREGAAVVLYEKRAAGVVPRTDLVAERIERNGTIKRRATRK